AAGVAGDDGAARRDVDRHAAVGGVVDRGVDGRVVLALEGHPVTGPERAHEVDGLPEPRETLLERRPLALPARGDLVERLAGADAEEHPARVEQTQIGR